jgi:hypothetical protein
MLLFKNVYDAPETGILHSRLWTIVEWSFLPWQEETGEPVIIVTEVWRSRQQTLRIYAEAGLPAPAFSVHEDTRQFGNPLTGCRGIDFSARSASRGIGLGLAYGEWPLIPRFRLEAFAERVNATWRYHAADEKQVALVHDVSGLHVHLQVRSGDETVRRT